MILRDLEFPREGVESPEIVENIAKKILPVLLILSVTTLFLLVSIASAYGGTGKVQGRVVNGTTGHPVSGLMVNLFSFDSSGARSGIYTATTDARGRFLFEQVEISPGAEYVAASRYKGVAYYSDTGTFSDTREISLPFEIFETTSDPGVVAADQVIWSVNFGKRKLLVGEMYFLSNGSNRTYFGEDGNGTLFTLPDGAEEVQFREGEIGRRFVEVSGTTYADVLPLIPGRPHRVSIRYTIPYTGTKATLRHAIPYPVGQFGIFVENIGEDAWLDIPAEERHQTIQGTDYLSFTSSNIPAGKEIRLELRKLPGEPRKPLPWWAYVGMMGAGTAIGAGAAFLTRRAGNRRVDVG